MPIQIYSINYTEAQRILSSIIEHVNNDSGSPVAVAVVDAASRLIAFAAMDGVAPASMKLSQSKAYSAVIGQKNTQHWAELSNRPGLTFDMRNWTDADFSGFTGGVVINHNGVIIGGVGVSGRKGKMDDQDVILQDEELAQFGIDAIFN